MQGMKSSLQRELDRFYKEVTGSTFNIREVTKGAFTKARAKLNPNAFIELTENVIGTFYSSAPYKTWHGMRLVAADGSRIALPNHQTVIEEFGQHKFGRHADIPRSIALCSLLYDPLNLVTLNAQIRPFASCERDVLLEQLDHIKKGDLLLLDRGYPSYALLFELKALGIEFCARMKESWLTVKQFSESGQTDQIVTFELPAKDHGLLSRYPKLRKKIKVRLFSIQLENGEREVLCTSLTDQECFSKESFYELYHYRWNIEEAYKLFKARIEIENFSGKTARAVKQDFHAKIFIMNLSAVLAFPIEEKVRAEWDGTKTKFSQKINRTSALSMTSSISVALFLKRLVQQTIYAFDQLIAKTLEVVRPGRRNERKKQYKKPFNMNYKRW
jgi:hypothetical protein